MNPSPSKVKNPYSIQSMWAEVPEAESKNPSNEKLHEQLNEIVIKTLQQMVDDRQRRLEGFRNNPALLDAGVMYAYEHWERSQECKDREAKVRDFVQKNLYFHGYLDSRYFVMFESRKSPTGIWPNLFRLKGKHSAAEALVAAQHGLSFLGCGEVVQIARYRALLEFFGKEKFDALFAGDGLTPMVFSQLHPQNPLHQLTYVLLDPTIRQRGQLVNFGNVIKLYKIKHINGDGGGQYAVQLDESPDPKYLGFGLNPLGVTQTQIEDSLLAEYNRKPIEFGFCSKSIASKLLDRDDLMRHLRMRFHTLTKQQFKEMNGGQLVPIVSDFCIERVALLGQKTIEEAQQLLAEWSKIENSELTLKAKNEQKLNIPLPRIDREQSKEFVPYLTQGRHSAVESLSMEIAKYIPPPNAAIVQFS